MRVAILGLGEAGRLYAQGFLGLGVDVSAYDPVGPSGIAGMRVADSIATAVGDAEIVVSLVGAGAADAALGDALERMPAEAIFADLNTGSPELKRALAERAAQFGIRFADVAVMAPVPRAGVLTPLILSGTGAEPLAAAWSPLGIPSSVAGGIAGTAAGLKLLRSVFMKGLAALVIESVSAAEIVDSAAWMRAEIAAELGPDGDALVDRLIDGTHQHAARREKEMRDVTHYLDSLGTPSWMSRGATEWLHVIATAPPA